MADLVNGTHKSALSSRNAEGSHLGGQSYDTLGGPGTASEPNGPDYKIDANKGISKDTSIPAAVGPEASHLKTEGDEDADELDVRFEGDDDVDVDDLDAQLDELDSLDPVDVDIKESDDDEDEKLDEEDDEDGDKKVDESDDDDENPFAKKVDESDDEDDKEKVDESDDDENPFAKKDKVDESDDEDDKEKVDESDDEDDKEKVDESDDEDEKELKESVKIRIKMPDVKLFESAGLGARTQKKVATVFESAIRSTTKQVSAQLHAHYKKLHEAKIAKREAVLAKQLDGYLGYVVEEWVKSNRVAIRSSLRAQLAEEFLSGLQRLFKEHYIDVPESKVDVVAKLTEQNAKLKKSLNEQTAKSIKIRNLAEAANKRRIVAEFSIANKLSEAASAKLQKLAEDTTYTNAKDFRGKLAMLKESYLAPTAKKLDESKRLAPENLQEETKTPAKAKASEYPEVDAVVGALSKKSTW